MTPLGGKERSGLAQHRSKSPDVMILPSTKILCIVRRPSSTSVVTKRLGGLPAGALLWEGVDLKGGAVSSGRGSAGKLPALLSISVSAARTSGSSGNR